MCTTALILPGIGGSGPSHWQSQWEVAHENFIRVHQRDWNAPVCNEWIENLENAVARVDGDIVLAAHSLGCLLLSHWAAQTQRQVKGALLVAPPDPAEAIFPKAATGFSPFPLKKFNFPSILVASSNDSFGDLVFAKSCATAWGSQFINAGAVGHINADSELGLWSEGLDLYQKLAR